jgi:hypothetical protein
VRIKPSNSSEAQAGLLSIDCPWACFTIITAELGTQIWTATLSAAATDKIW